MIPTTKISGVNAMYLYELNNKKYYMFGDKHYGRRENDCEINIKCDDFDYSYNYINFHNTGCISIGALLYIWFIYNNDHHIKTDFYLETSFTKENNKTSIKIGYDIMHQRKLLQKDIDYDKDTVDHQFDAVSWLNLFDFVAEPCFIRDKQGCPFYPNVHLHYADIRFIDGSIPVGIDPFILHDIQKYYKNIKYNVQDFNTLLNILISQYQLIFRMIFTTTHFDHYKNKLIKLSSLLSEPMKTLYINKINNIDHMTVIRGANKMHRVAAELLKLKSIDHTLSTRIKKFILNEADTRASRLQILYNAYIEDDDENDDDLNYFTDLLLPIGALSMDAYLLSRMFIQKGIQNVIYAGSHHIETYVKFFSTLTETLIVSPSIPDNRCLTIQNLSDYLNIDQYKKHYIYTNI